jgi:hypothetical protein
MQVSEARTAASQSNGAMGHGPLTPETRAISARNSLKHGLTGKGIVTSEGDREEIDRRLEALTADMKPMSAAGVFLIAQMATLSYRAEKAAEHEAAMIARNVRHAPVDFDEQRIEAADALFEALGEAPRNNLRKLRKMPEGVERLIEGWNDLRADLSIEPKPKWTSEQLVRAANMLGLKDEHARGSRIGALSRGFWGEFEGLSSADGGGLKETARQEWSKAALFEFIDAQVAALESHYETLDFETIELDRAEAGSRALFDDSKAATLARRYEAEAHRGFFKALKEFRIVEAEAAAKIGATPAPKPAPADAKVGSSRENPPSPAREPARPFPDAPSPEYPNPLGRDGQPLVFVRPEKLTS